MSIGRYQFIWWGWTATPLSVTGRTPPAAPYLRTIYEWTVNLGPLQIRKWTQRDGGETQ